MIIDSPIISGSQLSSGPLTQVGDVYITGSLNVLGAINGSITGSITSASYATNAEFLDRLDSTSFVFTSSFETYSGSVSTRETNLEATASTLTTASASFAVVSSSFATTSGSLSTRVADLEATSSTNTQASASFAVVSASFSSTSGSLSTRVTNLEATSSTVSSSFATTSGSIAERVTLVEGQYATTGSNTFTGPQFISQASNAIGFTSTASLYTDGGLRVAKDSYVSGTAYFNNITVYGTSSIQYITSSQVNIGSNIITVNTDTPAIRFGGLSVFDSGSTQLTGSIFWDSEKNHWIYSNPSGSTYNSGMLISGPRNSGSLGSEEGTTFNALMKGQGGDHITSSQMFDDGTTVRIPGNLQVTGSTVLSSALTGSSALFSGVVSTLSSSTNGFLAQTNANSVHPYFRWVTNNRSYWAAAIDNGTDATFKIGSGNTINTGTLFTIDSGTNTSTFSTALSGTSADFTGAVGTGVLTSTISSAVNAIFNSTNANGGYITFRRSGTPIGYLGNSAQLGGGVLNALELRADNDLFLTTTSGLLRLTSGGSVGINNTSPASNVGLSVKRPTSTGWIIEALNSSNTRMGGFYVTGGNNGQMYLANSSGTENVVLDTAGNSYFNGGNVGIGTSSPSSTLHIRGTFGAPLTSGTAQNGFARFGQTSGNGVLDIGFGDPYSWLQSRNTTDYSVNYNISLNPNGGNVGIGTISPATKLHVSGPIGYGTSTYPQSVKFVKTGTNSVAFTVTIPYSNNWAPASATVRVAGSRTGLEEHYAGLYLLRLTYYGGAGVTLASYFISGTDGVTFSMSSNTSNPQVFTLTINDAGASTDYLIADLDISVNGGIISIS